MSKRFSERILRYIRTPGYEPMQVEHLAEALGIGEEEYGDFHDAVRALHRVGRVLLGSDEAVMLPRPPRELVGTYRGNPRGFGFVVPDETSTHGDLFIPPGANQDAITGDQVLCQVVSTGKRSGGRLRYEGKVVKVVARGHSRFVGRLRQESGLWFVRPDGNALHVPIRIGDVGAKGAKLGDQVVVELVQYPLEGKPAKGVIVERLGKSGTAEVDLLSMIRQHHLPDVFPDAVLAETRARAAAFDPEAEAARREDLSDRLVITIDPDDARDFDDAISLEELSGGGHDHGAPGKKSRKSAKSRGGDGVWELGVHIADVSHFVEPGGALDESARERGTSVYFPKHVIPMLPEALSNGLCSLQEGEPRLCKSAFIRYDAEGRVVGARFAETVIRSAKRLTYGQATAILDGEEGIARKPVVELIERMNKLARIIRKRRLEEGMVVLSLPEIEVVLNDQGQVTDAQPADTSFSHTIIEMFMVEANEAIARLLHRLGTPFIRRIHPDPSEEALEAVAHMLRAAGYPAPKELAAADLQGILESLRGREDSYAVNLAILKSMQLAEYSPRTVGHFALASEHYTHFTSPIRRYADLTIHRQLKAHLAGQLKGKTGGGDPGPDKEELTRLARDLSYKSRRAEEAEREYKTLKILQLLSRHVGTEFDGIVTGVANFGVFVQHPKFLVDGLLRLEEMGGDWWEVDLKSGRVMGERTRQVLALGSLVKVRIIEVDLAGRQMNLGLVNVKPRRGKRGEYEVTPEPSRRAGNQRSKPKAKHRGRARNSRRQKPSRKRR